MNQDPDLARRLLTAVVEQDIAAFRRLYDLTLSRLTKVARFITRDRVMAEDVLQVSFLKIWENASQFDPARGSAIGWMLRICRNVAIDEIRKERLARSRRDLASVWFGEAAVPPPDALSIRDYLRHLPAEQAEAVLSVYELGLTQAEVATKLEIPLGTVKSWVRRALTSVRRSMP